MANQVTIKKAASVDGTFKASIFNEEGVPVLNGWQEFDLGSDMVWDPAKYGAPVTSFYIAKGIGPDPENQFVAYAVKVEFNENVEDATITLGIGEVTPPNGGSGCNFFEPTAEGVSFEVITDGVPVAGTELPSRCAGQIS